MNPWLALVLAGLLEVAWASALAAAQGFTRFWPSALGVTAAVASLLLLSYALRSLPVGTAYAVWVGIGALGVAAVGAVAFGEDFSASRLGCISLIVAGVVGLKVLE